MRRSTALPRLVFVHHAGIADALDDHDRDEFAEAVILPALPPYAYMKLGATPGFIDISLPVNGHETRSLLHGSC